MCRSPSACDVEVDQPVAGDLVEHVVEEGHAGGEFALAGAIEIETHGNLRLQGITDDFGVTHDLRPQKALERRAMIPFRPRLSFP